MKLRNFQRPSSTANGHFEQEVDDEIEEGDKKNEVSKYSWSMSGVFFFADIMRNLD